MNMNCRLFQQECDIKDTKEVKKPDTTVVPGKVQRTNLNVNLVNNVIVLPFEIVNIFSHLGRKEQILQNIFQKVEAEHKNEVKKDTEIFGGEVKKKKKHNEHVLETNLNTLHQDFYNHQLYENKDDKQNTLNVLKFTKKKMMKTILGFTNNLVSENSLK